MSQRRQCCQIIIIKKENIRHWFSFKLEVSVPEHYALHDLLTSMNSFSKQPLWTCVCPRQSMCADRVIQKLSHLHSNASLPILPLSLPRSRGRLPSPGPVVKVTQHAPRWRADRRVGRGGFGGGVCSIFIAPGPPCVGAALGLGWLQTAAGFPGSEQLSSFFNTAAPTSGPGEGDLPCLTEGLLNCELSSTPCRNQPTLISTLLLQRQFSVCTVQPQPPPSSLLFSLIVSLFPTNIPSFTSPPPLLPPPLPTA